MTTPAKLARAAIPLALVGLLPLFVACNLLGGEEPTPVPTPVAVVSTPRPTEVPTATPTPTPRPTPTPSPNLSSAEVERIVFLQVRTCADQISSARETNVEIKVIPTYDQPQRRWTAEVVSNDGALSFGRWAVLDTSRDVSPLDDVASSIAAPATICAEPVARIAKAPVPPLFPTATPSPTITSVSDAELRVWVAVYGCYAGFPQRESFKAYPYSQGDWIVEGKSPDTQYGLWVVDSATAEVSPLDQLAREAATGCSLRDRAAFPPAFTGPQAELRVWAAVYDCFNPKPQRESFVSYVDSPTRWLVEGKSTTTLPTVYYGFWLVDATTAAIQAWDQLAKTTAASPCYHIR